MSRSFFLYAVILAGAAVAVWVGAGYAASNPLALAMILLIGAAYAAGVVELLRYRRATGTLVQALGGLSGAPANLDSWFATVHASLRNAVRLRIEGVRAALPGPALAPYLIGLLVLLGMLGTFLGMIATLRGTSLALETGTDLQAIRDALAAPVKGLGFAFGTSVAGVATSAMLGLLSALCQRERLQAAQNLDTHIATTLRAHSPSSRREETFKLMQRQAEALPALADRMQAMMAAMEQQAQTLNDRLAASHEALSARLSAGQEVLGERLSTGHDALSLRLSAAYEALTDTAARSLRDHAAASAQAVGEAIQPAVQATLAGLARDAEAWRGAIAQATSEQVAGLAERFAATTGHAADGLASATAQIAGRLEGHAQSLAQGSAALLTSLEQSHAGLAAQLAERDAQRLAAFTQQLDDQAVALRQGWEQTNALAAEQHKQLCGALARTADDIAAQAEARAQGTLAEMARLLQAAEQAPQAVADVIGELRRKQSEGLERDNAMLQERARLLETLGVLFDTANQSATRQREAIDALIAASGERLENIGARFAQETEAQAGRLAEAAVSQADRLAQVAATETDRLTQVAQAEAGKLAQAADQITSGATQAAELGASLGEALQSFSQSNTALAEQLQRIEAALDKSMTRSDEQLAYYVAQAREVVDLSLLSQKQILEDLQRVARA